MPGDADGEEAEVVLKPHAHDVLCGRGGLTNQHAGNEWFRRLVRSNRALYRSCPKHTKLLVSKAIVQAVQQQDPPGRFLEMSKKDNGLWRPIPYKRAVDKTSQALREREPPAGPGANGKAGAGGKDTKATSGPPKKGFPKTLEDAGVKLKGTDQLSTSQINIPKLASSESADAKEAAESKKRKAETSQFVKPAWWRKGTLNTEEGSGDSSKKSKLSTSKMKRGEEEPDPMPLPPQPLQTRQSSMFRFLSQTGIFGSKQQPKPPPVPQRPSVAGGFPFEENTASSAVARNNPFEAQMGHSFQMQQLQQQQQQMARAMSGQNPSMSAAASVAANFDAQQQQQLQRLSGVASRTGSVATYDSQLRASQLALQQQQQRASINMQQPQRSSLSMQQQTSIADAAAAASAFDAQLQQQDSMFGGGNNNNAFMALGGQNGMHPPQQQQQQNQMTMNGGFSMRSMQRQSMQQQTNPAPQQQANSGLYGGVEQFMDLQPTPMSAQGVAPFAQAMQGSQHQQQMMVPPRQPRQQEQQQNDMIAPPLNRLTTQVSDWLESFWPLGKEGSSEPPKAASAAAPQQPVKQEDVPPPTTTLEPGISSTLFKLASTPSRLFSNLKSGVSAYFDGTSSSAAAAPLADDMSGSIGSTPAAAAPPPPNTPGIVPPPPIIGTSSSDRRSSLLDDYDETPQELALRSVTSR